MFTICLERGGNGNPLQYSCLENPMDRGAWWATVHRVAKSWTRLKSLSTYVCQFHIHVSFTPPPTTWETEYTETIARPYTILKSRPYDIYDSDPQLPATSPRIQTTAAWQPRTVRVWSTNIRFLIICPCVQLKTNQRKPNMLPNTTTELQLSRDYNHLPSLLTLPHFFHSKGLPLPPLLLCLPNANCGCWLSRYSKLWINNLFSFATPWTVAHQAPGSMGFSRQEYWSG